MKYGYLVLASARRVLNVVLGDDTDAIRHTIGCWSIEHGTTLASEDQLIIDGSELDGVPDDRFWVVGVPFPFCGNGLLIGTDPISSDTADAPAMELEEFRRLVSFTSQTGVRRAAAMEGHQTSDETSQINSDIG